MPSFHKIATPEAVDLHLELAGVGNRLQAKLIDFFWKYTPVVIIVIAFSLLNLATIGSIGVGFLTTAGIAGLFVLAFVYIVGWGIYFEARRNGQTPGKAVAGIRVIDEHGYPLSFRQVVIRNLVGFADMLPVLYALGGLMVYFTDRAQRLGDMAAGTLVIREREAGQAQQIFANMTFLEVHDPVVPITRDQLARFTATERKVIKDLFLRESAMDAQAFSSLVHQIAVAYHTRGAFTDPLPPELNRRRAFLAELYLALRDAQL